VGLAIIGLDIQLVTYVFVVMQSVTLANHRAPVSLAASVFSIGEVMLAVTGVTLVRDPKAWIVSEPSSVIAIVYAVRFTSIHLLQTHSKCRDTASLTETNIARVFI